MPLTPQQVQVLITAVCLTREDEIDCGECLTELARFAEENLSGRPIPEALRRAEEHLAFCGECREEYELLVGALKMAGGPDHE